MVPQSSSDRQTSKIKEKYKDIPHFNLGRIHSEETRRKYSESRKGEKNPNWGNGQKIKGERNPMYGKNIQKKLEER